MAPAVKVPTTKKTNTFVKNFDFQKIQIFCSFYLFGIWLFWGQTHHA